jgi:hypothetical protein
MPTPKTVAEAFTELDDNLKLNPLELADAIEWHHTITKFLTDKGLIEGAFLQGSLKKKTMIDPLRDIDKVVLIPGDPDNPGSSLARANEIAEALRTEYPQFEIEVGKHSILIDMGDDTFEFDVVPAYDLGDDIKIINTSNDGWNTSNTRQMIAAVQERNGECNGKFIRYIRAGKLFVREQLDCCIPGLHVEAFAYNVITEEMPFDEALAAIFTEGARCLAPGTEYTEPTGKERLDSRLSTDARQKAHAAFFAAAADAKEAAAAHRRGQHNAAIAIWYKLLGECFPKPNEDTAIDDLGQGKGITRIITPAAPVVAPPTRAWRA